MRRGFGVCLVLSSPDQDELIKNAFSKYKVELSIFTDDATALGDRENRIEDCDAIVFSAGGDRESSLQTLRSLLALGLPVLVVLDQLEEELGERMIAAGASDFLAISDIGQAGLLDRYVSKSVARSKARCDSAELMESIIAEMENFSYVASHELQEPMRKIRSFVDIVVEDCSEKLSQEDLENLDIVSDAALRMQRLIDDLLDYSRLGSGALDVKDIEISDVYSDSLDSLSSDVESRQAKVVKRISLESVRSDRTMLVRVFQNLISNSLKFVPEDRNPEIEVDGADEGSHWRFSVRDNGIGLETSDKEKIFSMFQRLHARTKYSGTGMGLAVCKRLVERMGGSIWVDSQPGAGSTFHFTISKDQQAGIEQPKVPRFRSRR